MKSLTRKGRPALRRATVALAAVATAVAGLTAVATPAAAATQFILSNVPGAVSAGEPVDLTIRAVNADGSIDTAYTGTVTLTTDNAGSTVAAPIAFQASDAGQRSVTAAVRFGTATGPTGSAKITASDGTITATTAGTQVGSPTEVTKVLITGLASPMAAGTQTTMTVTALNSLGSVANQATAPVTVSGPGVATTSGAFANGVFTSLVTVGAGTYTATAGTATDRIAVATPAPTFAGLLIEGLNESGTVQGAGRTLTVTALDALGRVFPGYTGRVTFSSTDAQATLPAAYTFTAADQGIKSFPDVRLRTVDIQTISVTDGTVTARQQAIVNEAPPGTVIDPPAPPPSTVSSVTLASSSPTITAGNRPFLTGRVLDGSGNGVGGQQVTISQKRYLETTYSTLTTVTSAADGTFRFQVNPERQTAYVAAAGGKSSRAVVQFVFTRIDIISPVPQRAAVSLPRSTTVRARFTVASPGSAAGIATLSGGRFTVIGQGPQDGSGVVSIPVTLPTGQYSLVVFTSARNGQGKGARSVGVSVR